MNRHFPLTAPCLAVAALLCPGVAWAQASPVTCSLTAPSFSGPYVDTANLDQTGSFTINCTRATGSNGKLVVLLRLSLSQAAAGQTMATGYPDTLNYNIYRDAGYANLWTTGAEAASGASGVETSLEFKGNSSAPTVSPVLVGYQRIPLGQTGKATGTYSRTLVATLTEIDIAGAVLQTLATANVTSQATVAKTCSFGAPLPTYSLNYVAFRGTNLVDTSQAITLTCTKGTTYTLGLDQTVAAIPGLGLTYRLLFASTSSGTVPGSSTSGLPTSYPLDLLLPSGQAGSCNAGSCSGSSLRVITVTY